MKPLVFAGVAVAAAALSSLSSLSSLLAADTPATLQWLVTSAKATGAGGEQFVTSIRVVNPNPTSTSVDLFFLPASAIDGSGSALGDNSNPAKTSFTVPAGQSFAIEDVLGSKFNATGAGGLRVESRLPVSVLSQTLNASARSASGVPGTFGFAIPAQTADQAVSQGDTAYVPYISSAPDGASVGYRTNLFLLSANSSVPTVVNVRLARADGTTLGQADTTLGKGSQTQINRIASQFGYSASDTNLVAWVTVKSGGPVVTGASVIDNAIGSISYAPPFKVFEPNNGAFGLLFTDGGYDFSSGRLDILAGVPDYLSASLVLDGCPASPGPVVQNFPVQAFFSGSKQNSSFSLAADGSFSFNGSASGATWTGTISGRTDGSVFGSITYARATGAAGTTCPGVSKTLPYSGSRVVAFPAP